ncbi:Hpt domain-containing protein [Arenicella xantha]|uniref:Hpt domain-containing protein n=1 Tax=Arenicella xantha TaxID=644221 RepID=A0A395JKF2_9GAMM|nr:Hpt domain-containing protein [Arenicella xantha]RBP49258.1 Hpt domain-containing protein [Arenicella xantha]
MSVESPTIVALKQRYKASLPEKIEELVLHIAALNAEGGNGRESLQELHGFLHRLAGSTGMYGYDDLSALCQSGIKFIQQEDLNNLAAELQRLREMLEQYAQG